MHERQQHHLTPPSPVQPRTVSKHTTRNTRQGSQAYAKALSKAGILTAEEADTIVGGLDKVRVTSRVCVCV